VLRVSGAASVAAPEDLVAGQDGAGHLSSNALNHGFLGAKRFDDREMLVYSVV